MNDRLDSWKEIAEYLKRDVRTVQRWEQTRGLPVRRVPGGGHAAVYALQPELEAWLNEEPRHFRRRVATAAAVMLIGGAAIAAWWYFGRSSGRTTGRTTPSARTLPFTSYPGVELQPAFSPDGSQIAFVWDGEAGGNSDIYVKLVAGGTPLRLTTNPAEDFSPTWSPDGTRIAFLSETASGLEINLIPALGGPERKLCLTRATLVAAIPVAKWSRTGLGLAWSPDGRVLAAVDKGSPQEPDGIFLISTESGEKRRLTSLPAQSFGDRFPVFSPNGQILALARFRSLGVADIYLLPVAGGETRRLTFDDRDIRGLDWTPDGRSIVFSSSRGGGYSLWRIPISGGTPEPLATSGATVLLFPSIARQGNRMAYVQSVADLDIWRAPGPTAGPGLKLPPTKVISSTHWDSNPQISPDGKRIVFASARSGAGEVWVCDEAGLNPVQVTSFGGPLAASPRWSPDSRQIAFDGRAHGHADIFVISAEGGAQRRITTEPSNEVRPSWSSDGRWIYFGSDRAGSWQVWKAPTDGGGAVQVTKHGGREAQESPDGRFVYYHKNNTPGIWRAPVEGGEEVQVIEQAEPGQWAVLAQGLCLLNRKAKPEPAIEFFSFDTGRLAKITSLPKEAASPLLIPALAVSPDGRWVLYVQLDQVTSDIMLAENFR
jgi:Tol biopolymer transport system component